MDEKVLKNLVGRDQLKFDLLARAAKKRQLNWDLRYDKSFDCLVFVMRGPICDCNVRAENLAVFYDDGPIALLFDQNSMEVVGFQVEDFVVSILAESKTIRQLWHMAANEDVGEVMLELETRKPRIVKEVLREYPPEVPNWMNVEDLVDA